MALRGLANNATGGTTGYTGEGALRTVTVNIPQAAEACVCRLAWCRPTAGRSLGSGNLQQREFKGLVKNGRKSSNAFTAEVACGSLNDERIKIMHLPIFWRTRKSTGARATARTATAGLLSLGLLAGMATSASAATVTTGSGSCGSIVIIDSWVTGSTNNRAYLTDGRVQLYETGYRTYENRYRAQRTSWWQLSGASAYGSEWAYDVRLRCS